MRDEMWMCSFILYIIIGEAHEQLCSLYRKVECLRFNTNLEAHGPNYFFEHKPLTSFHHTFAYRLRKKMKHNN